MAVVDVWAYRAGVEEIDLSDFKVEAVDGEIGKVDKQATEQVDPSSIVVDTGPWILGKKSMLPVGVITAIDSEEQVIRVDRTKEEIKNAPEWDPTGYVEQEYRLKLGEYYSGFYT
jgi:hypothetical protein